MIDLTSAAGPLELVSKGGPLVWLLLVVLVLFGGADNRGLRLDGLVELAIGG